MDFVFFDRAYIEAMRTSYRFSILACLLLLFVTYHHQVRAANDDDADFGIEDEDEGSKIVGGHSHTHEHEDVPLTEEAAKVHIRVRIQM